MGHCTLYNIFTKDDQQGLPPPAASNDRMPPPVVDGAGTNKRAAAEADIAPGVAAAQHLARRGCDRQGTRAPSSALREDPPEQRRTADQEDPRHVRPPGCGQVLGTHRLSDRAAQLPAPGTPRSTSRSTPRQPASPSPASGAGSATPSTCTTPTDPHTNQNFISTPDQLLSILDNIMDIGIFSQFWAMLKVRYSGLTKVFMFMLAMIKQQKMFFSFASFTYLNNKNRVCSVVQLPIA